MQSIGIIGASCVSKQLTKLQDALTKGLSCRRVWQVENSLAQGCRILTGDANILNSQFGIQDEKTATQQ
jgi:hypothetical protein